VLAPAPCGTSGASGNGWFDATDAAFATLGVWVFDGAGPERLSTSAESGVCALQRIDLAL